MLQQLTALLEEREKIELGIEAAEKQLTELKTKKLRLDREIIPDLLAEANMTSVTTDTGLKVTVVPFVDAHITDEYREPAHKWLRDHGFDALIKTAFDLRLGKQDQSKMQELITQLNKLHLPYAIKESVHYQTLKSFVRESLEQGRNLPVDLFGVFTGRTTKIAKD